MTALLLVTVTHIITDIQDWAGRERWGSREAQQSLGSSLLVRPSRFIAISHAQHTIDCIASSTSFRIRRSAGACQIDDSLMSIYCTVLAPRHVHMTEPTSR